MAIISQGGLTESAGEHVKLLSLEAQMTTADLTAQQTDTQVHCGHFPIWIIQSSHPSSASLRIVRITVGEVLSAHS